MVLGYLLLILIPLAAVAYIFWDHRRKAAQRVAASAGRLQELLGATPAPAPQQDTSKSARPAPAAPASIHSVSAGSTAQVDEVTPFYAVRERLLDPAQTLLYQLLRTGLPNHLVFADMTLASVLDVGPGGPGYARTEQVRRLAAHTLDFVVADRGMKPVAVVKLRSAERNGTAQGEGDPVSQWLASAGVRYVEIAATALPRKEAIGDIVLGVPGSDHPGPQRAS